MAGPGIRYWELARVLAQDFPVTLAVPGQTALQGDGPTVQSYHMGEWETLRRAAEESDVIIPCGHTLARFPALADLETPLVIDGYDPFLVESLALHLQAPLERRLACHEEALTLLRQQCSVGDFFMCATERQRDYWLGLLEACGRINPHTYAADPRLRQLVDVVPFGLPAEPPEHNRQVMKGVIPGIGMDDTVVLWGGGVWEWLDPLTLIKALPGLIQERPDVRLVFPGTQHPNAEDVPDMPMLQKARGLARELGLLERHVFFGGWVEYAEWPNYLLETDIGVSLHFDTLESRLAFRTRVLDYISAELPMVVTRGDVVSQIVVEHGLGRVVDFEDVAGVTQAILDLLDVDQEVSRPRFAERRKVLTWEQVAEPLIAFCRSPRRAADRRLSTRSTGEIEEDRVGVLQNRLEHCHKEVERLRESVKGYEEGRLMRFMKWMHEVFCL